MSWDRHLDGTRDIIAQTLEPLNMDTQMDKIKETVDEWKFNAEKPSWKSILKREEDK